MTQLSKTVEIAITSPTDGRYPSVVYFKTYNEFGDEKFRRIGGSHYTNRRDLLSRGAQFHELTVPAWRSAKELAAEKLEAFAKELEDDFYLTWAERAREALELVNKV